jgi:hypothetical protein
MLTHPIAKRFSPECNQNLCTATTFARAFYIISPNAIARNDPKVSLGNRETQHGLKPCFFSVIMIQQRHRKNHCEHGSKQQGHVTCADRQLLTVTIS